MRGGGIVLAVLLGVALWIVAVLIVYEAADWVVHAIGTGSVW